MGFMLTSAKWQCRLLEADIGTIRLRRDGRAPIDSESRSQQRAAGSQGERIPASVEDGMTIAVFDSPRIREE